MSDNGLLLTVSVSDEPDEVYDFPHEGMSRLFGRDDSSCEIVIWSALRGTELSRVAGRIWRMDGELWVRNLSTRHELYLSRPGMPAEPPLPPRWDDGVDPGPARSVPAPVAYLLAPGGCDLVLRQRPGPATLPTPSGELTARVPPIPPQLRTVAVALCEPLLSGGLLPAAYSEITARAGTGSVKRTRTLVGQLCALYLTEVPHLQERWEKRVRQEEAELELPAGLRLRRGIWVLPDDVEPERHPEDLELRRRRALALPDYFEVAHLLVRRRLVTTAHLALLPEARRGADGAERVR